MKTIFETELVHEMGFPRFFLAAMSVLLGTMVLIAVLGQFIAWQFLGASFIRMFMVAVVLNLAFVVDWKTVNFNKEEE